MDTKDTIKSSNDGLYNNTTLSDITIKFNGRQVFAHKAILAQKSAYFMVASTSLLPAASEEVDLGDDDDPEAIHAMMRHIYDMPYAEQSTGTSSFENDLIFCLNVFIVADKYDVTGLRQKVAPDFHTHLQRTWQTEAFNSSPSISRSTGTGKTSRVPTFSMTTSNAATGGDESLFNNETLSDVLIKFGNQQQLHGHKAVLARRSKYFYKAFSGQFPVATSKEIDLGDDEDPEAIRAMIRHIYDFPYDQMLVEITADNAAAYSTNEDLLFHIAVFTAADKYDIPSLRPLVVKKFEDLMEINWESENFATSIQKLTGPSAGHLADNNLRAAAAAFCAKNLTKLIKQDNFVNMIQEEEPFTGRLLTDFLTGGSVGTVQLRTCSQVSCRNTEPSVSTLQGFLYHCVVCGQDVNNGYSGRGAVDYKKAYVI